MFETPDIRLPEMAAFLAQFPSTPFVTTRSKDTGPAGHCYSNVRDMVERHGGEPLLGFEILWVPGRLIEALHHCLWRDPSGAVWDVSRPPYAGMQDAPGLFVLDPHPKPLGNIDPVRDSIFKQLDEDEVTAAFIQAALDATAIRRRGLKVITSGPYVVDPKFGPQPLAGHKKQNAIFSLGRRLTETTNRRNKMLGLILNGTKGIDT